MRTTRNDDEYIDGTVKCPMSIITGKHVSKCCYIKRLYSFHIQSFAEYMCLNEMERKITN